MNKKQEFLKKACDEFRLKIEFDVPFKLTSGDEESAEAVIFYKVEDNIYKMYIVAYSLERGTIEFLSKEGHGCASCDHPGENEQFSLDHYKDMFLAWGLFYPKFA